MTVFDGGSLQFGNFPGFVPDGSGGAVFSWYDAGSLQLQCSVQHVLSDGTEAFGHNGSVVSTNATRVRVNPRASHDSATGLTYAYWVEQTSNQSQDGVYGQQFDAGGVRQWSNDGAVIVPVGSNDITAAPNIVIGDQTLVVWDSAPSFGTCQIRGALVDSSGNLASGPFDVSSLPASKSRVWPSPGAQPATAPWPGRTIAATAVTSTPRTSTPTLPSARAGPSCWAAPWAWRVCQCSQAAAP